MQIKDAIAIYVRHLRSLNRSPITVKNVRYALRHLTAFLEREAVDDIESLCADILDAYRLDLAFYRTVKGGRMEAASQGKILSAVKGFTRYLRQADYLVADPAETMPLPKVPMRLPRTILSPKEVKVLLSAPDMRSRRGYRDRILLEVLYDTAVRRAEVARIRLPDLDLDAGFIRIQGKGDRQRVVPISARVCELVKNYLLFVRPLLARDKDQGYLIAGRWGGPMNLSTINAIVKDNARRSGIKRKVTPHTLRHTCATHMLKNGAPIRHIQELLGHACIETTQVYTRVTINDLKKIHARYHPSQHL